MIWSVLSRLALAGCFFLLLYDFLGFFYSEDEPAYLTISSVVSEVNLGQVNLWSMQQDTTWGNITRLVLKPFISWVPLWLLFCLLALVFRSFGRGKH